MAYGEVLNVNSGMISMGEYENPDKIKPSDQTTAVAEGIMKPLVLANSQQWNMLYSTDVSVCQ